MAQIMTDTGLKYTDIKVGDGQTCTGRGQTVLVHYEGWLETGEKFDSSRDLAEPFSFPVACSYVIAGWDEGVVGMKIGGVRKLTVPPELGYGDRSAGRIIPASATLIFEIELLEISE